MTSNRVPQAPRSLANEGRNGDPELDNLIRQRNERERESRELEERIHQRTQNLARTCSRSRSPAARSQDLLRNPGSAGGRRELRQSTQSRACHQEDNDVLPEEECEIAEDSEANDDQVVDQDFYNKLFKMLRKTKSDKWSIRDKSTLAGQLSKIGRLVPHIHGPFVDMGVVITIGMAWLGGTPLRWVAAEDTLSSDQRKRLAKERACVHIFDWLQERLPFLEEVIPLMVGRAHDTFILGAFLDTHARQARATDLNSLKKALADYVKPAMIVPSLATIAPPNGNQRKDKDWYGWHSEWTGRLLVPRANREEFDEDPQLFCDGVLDGQIIIDHHDYPSYVYLDDGEEFDRDNIDTGLGRGELALKGMRHIFTSPSSVMKPPGKNSLGRGCISHIYKLDRVAPESIAYISVLIRSVLSSAPSWELVDGPFIMQEFFNNLVDLFKGPCADDEWARDTLIWWNTAIYGNSVNSPGVSNARRPAGARQSEVLALQRAARLAARHDASIAAAATATAVMSAGDAMVIAANGSAASAST